MRRRRTVLPVLMAAAALTGCWAPDARPPTLADGPLTEVYRIPSPVPAPPEGRREWAYTDTVDGILAEGRKLASVDLGTGTVRWTVTLPPAYAASTGNRPMAAEGFLMLPAGGAGVRVVSQWEGDTRWERRFAQRGQLTVAGSGPDAAVVHSACDAKGCDITALRLETGRPAWKIRTPERVTLVEGLYAVGERTITALSPLDGRRLWTVSTPPGPAPILKPSPANSS